MTIELYFFGVHLGTTGKADTFIIWFRWLGAIFVPIWKWKPIFLIKFPYFIWLDWPKTLNAPQV